MFKKYFIAAAIVAITTSSYAQTNTGTGTSNVDSRTSSGAASAANPTINQNFGGTPATTTQNINNVPALQLPSVIGGNPCGIGGSAGVSMMGIGVGGGIMVEGPNCEERQRIALYHNIGMARHNAGAHQDAAGWFAVTKEVACENKDTRKHFKRIGQPCLDDMPAGTAPVAIVSNVQVTTPKAKAFDPTQYSSSGDCYTAAHAQGVDLNACKQVWRETRAAIAAGVVNR